MNGLRHFAKSCRAVFFVYLLVVQSLKAQPPDLNRLLFESASRGDAQKVEELLKQGANANAKHSGNRTALHFAAQDGHVKVVQNLLDHGAEMNVKDVFGRTPLFEAAGNRNPEVTRVLLGAGAKPDGPELGQAAWLNRIEAVKLLLDADISPNEGLARAAQGGHIQMVKLLLQRGADINASSAGGNTGLHLAALQGGAEAVEVLLTNGADPNVIASDGKTPLHMAVTGDSELEIVKLLVRAGARLDIVDEEGLTPVRLAAHSGHKPIYDYFIAINGGKEPTPKAKTRKLAERSTKDLIAAIAAEVRAPEDHDKRIAAQRELVLRGKEIVPEVLQRIEAGAPIEPFYGLFAALGPQAEAALPKLEALLSDQKQVFGAALTIERMQPGLLKRLPLELQKKAAATLAAAMLDPKAEGIMIGFYARMLVKLGDVAAPHILKMLRSQDPRHRYIGAGTAGKATFSNAEITAELIALSLEGELGLREAAVRALGSFGEPTMEVKQTILKIIQSPPPFDFASVEPKDERRWAKKHDWGNFMSTAAGSLQRFEPEVIEDLIPLTSSKNEYQRIYATIALERLSEKSVPRLIELLGHHDEKVATAASVGLRGMSFRGNRLAAVPALAEAIRTGNEQVVGQAASTLWWIGPGAKQVLPILYEEIAREERSDASRRAITRAAVKIDPAATRKSKEVLSVIPLLIRMLETGDFEQQGWAAETLADIGPPAQESLTALYKKRGVLGPEGGKYARDHVSREVERAIAAIEEPELGK